jgi:glycosyltransferase involved in cell wall biosynthesis
VTTQTVAEPTAVPAAPGSGGRRVLFVSYPFPPVGGAGVQRTTKFVKYLPACGWQPSVLTVANPSVPALDESLVKDVPAATVVRRARTWEPSYAVKAAVVTGEGRRGGGVRGTVKGLVRGLVKLALQPDPQILWLPGAVREGRRLLRELPHAAIVASGPPFSTFLIGARLSRQTGVPLVLDYRDEWDISSAYWENKRLDRVSHGVQTWMQHAAVRAARALVATTRSSAAALEAVRDRARSTARVACIYNGYDPEDFPPVSSPLFPPGRGVGGEGGPRPYRLAYVGTLWNLTSVAPLVDAVARLAERSPALAADLELVFAGRRTEQQQQALDRLKALPCRLVEHPYLDHAKALELIRSSDGLCVLLSDLPHAGRVVPAKIFESMAARRPVLAIGPEGEMWDLLRDCPAAHLYRPADTAGIAECLAREIARRRETRPADGADWDCSRYSRAEEARQLAALLEALPAHEARA